jgi:RNA polymerase sigma factor (sigma-70 family)
MGLWADGAASTSVQPEAAEMDLGAAVVRAQAGDSEAFRLLYRDIQPRLLRYLAALAGPDAEDLASETWLQVTRDLPAFTGSYDGFRGWVATIARHRALDHLRARTRKPPALAVPAEDLAAWPAADDTAARALDAVATANAIALITTLPPGPGRSRPAPRRPGPGRRHRSRRPGQTTRRHPHRRPPRPQDPAQETRGRPGGTHRW